MTDKQEYKHPLPSERKQSLYEEQTNPLITSSLVASSLPILFLGSFMLWVFGSPTSNPDVPINLDILSNEPRRR